MFWRKVIEATDPLSFYVSDMVDIGILTEAAHFDREEALVVEQGAVREFAQRDRHS